VLLIQINQPDRYYSTNRTSRWVRPSYFRSRCRRHRAGLHKCTLDEAIHHRTSRTHEDSWHSLYKSTCVPVM